MTRHPNILTRSGGEAGNGGGNGNGNGTRLTLQLVFWILGALMTLVGLLSGIAHQMMMGQLNTIEHRIERLENRELGQTNSEQGR